MEPDKNKFHLLAEQKSQLEQSKLPKRTELINYLLSYLNRETFYLEIGVRDPLANFNQINATHKFGVDPGKDIKENLADFKMTSDGFFNRLINNQILTNKTKFDLIFIDGLHLAEQVDRDIANSLKFLRDDGFIVLHDCNPPTEWHARDEYLYNESPARDLWNGTTWKAFMKRRYEPNLFSCCIDSDWGIGIISTIHEIGTCIENTNPFYEYNIFNEKRNLYLNLIDFNVLRKKLQLEQNS
jgi:hypothetical protein